MNYYRRFIKNFASIAKPLNHLTRKKTEFRWSEECEKSFHKLKNAIIKPPILKYPNFSHQFTLIVDASKYGVGATLTQNYDNKDLPISFASRSFTKGELNKSTIEKEIAAIHFAVKHYKPYIYGTHFLIKTDHKPLTYLFSSKNPSSKLTRMRLDLEEFNYTVEYIKGSCNVIADALSRITSRELKLLNENNAQIAVVQTRSMSKKNKIIKQHDENHVNEPDSNDNNINIRAYEGKNDFKLPKMIFKEQMQLKVFLKRKNIITINKSYIIDKLLATNNDLKAVTKEKVLELFLNKLEIEADKLKLKIIQIFDQIEIFIKFSLNEFKKICNKELKFLKIAIVSKPKTVVTDEGKLNLLKIYHDNPVFGGHNGQKRMYHKFRSHFFWKNMSRDVVKFVRNCDYCIKNKPKN